MTLKNRITHQPKSNHELTTADIIFNINRLLYAYKQIPGVRGKEKTHISHILTILEKLK